MSNYLIAKSGKLVLRIPVEHRPATTWLDNLSVNGTDVASVFGGRLVLRITSIIELRRYRLVPNGPLFMDVQIEFSGDLDD